MKYNNISDISIYLNAEKSKSSKNDITQKQTQKQIVGVTKIIGNGKEWSIEELKNKMKKPKELEKKMRAKNLKRKII